MDTQMTAGEPRDERQLRRSRALIIGGGATGQVYGYHLAQAGVDVSYYLKPRHASEAEEGFTLHPMGLVGRRPSRNFSGFEVLTRPDEVKLGAFDQVWLCISGPALKAGVVADLAPRTGDATWVCLQPGLAAREYMLGHVEAQQLVMGMISLVAWQAPLPGEERSPEGVAYWLPPLSPTLFSGPRAELVANLLQRGGLGAAVKRDVEVPATFGSGALIPFVVALESSRWSFGTLRRSDVAIDRLCGSIAEIFAAAEAALGARPGNLAMLTKPFVWKLALLIAPRITPFPLPTYLKYHFSKLRLQSEQVIAEFLALCERQGNDAPNLEFLRETWLENRPPLEERPSGNTMLVAGDAGLAADSDPTPVPEEAVLAPLILEIGLEEETDVPDAAVEPAEGVAEPEPVSDVAEVAEVPEVPEIPEAPELPEGGEISEGTSELAAQIAADVSDLGLDETPSDNAEPLQPEGKPSLNLDKLRAKLQKRAAARELAGDGSAHSPETADD